MIRILIADDHPIIRDGLKQILSAFDDISVAGEASDGTEVMEIVLRQDFDVLVLDMTMPGKSGIELIKQIRIEKPKLPILILSMHKEEQYAVRALKAGASGYLCKDGASLQLVQAIRKVAGGGVFVSQEAAEHLVQALTFDQTDHRNLRKRSEYDAAPHTLLTDREFEIFRMIVRGQGVSKIAGELSLSVKTVSTHKTRILEKMHMSNTAELVRYAMNHGLIDADGNDSA
jgi:DNA-binding NarL/FixJ family response regulator